MSNDDQRESDKLKTLENSFEKYSFKEKWSDVVVRFASEYAPLGAILPIALLVLNKLYPEYVVRNIYLVYLMIASISLLGIFIGLCAYRIARHMKHDNEIPQLESIIFVVSAIAVFMSI
jgi:hypothetical protein